MSEETFTADDKNVGNGAAGDRLADEIVESDELVSRLLQFHEALSAGVTVDFTQDETVGRLPAETKARFDRLLDCLKLIDEVRREESVCWGRELEHSTTETLPVGPSLQEPSLAPEGSFPSFPNRVGRFEIRRVLGHGGHGVVFEAWDQFLHRLVALKLPRPATVLTPELRRRFVQEGRIAAGLRHPNIVPVLEAADFGPGWYIAQELCTGPTLAEWLASQSGPVSVQVAAAVVARLADAVGDAHGRGILHRDLKPANVLLQPTESADDPGAIGPGFPYVPKVTDFGIAKLLDDAGDPTITMTGIIIGTAAYMSPEQAAGDRSQIGPGSDVYALGAILYEMLTGRPPTDGSSPAEILRHVLMEEPKAARALRPEIPRDLEAVCLMCLEKKPDQRYSSAAQLADDLNRFLQGEPLRARRVGSAARLFRQARRRKFSSRAVLAGALAALATVGALAGFYWRARKLHAAAVASLTEKQREEKAAFQQAYADEIRRVDFLLHQPSGAADFRLVAQQGREILARYIPQPGDADLREFSWHYLWKTLHPEDNGKRFRQVRSVPAHQGAAYCVVFSPDGKRVATASADETARIWDVETGKLLLTLVGHTHEVNCVVFSPDGKTIATAGEDRTVRLWDAARGTPRGILWKPYGRGGLRRF